ncbi:ABC transporter ATP-binding protein [Acuticoccus kandeliae]|uniref:ABC transporter ATP-binding protein n=1 Tax=Acuticoccus kandeliae TaxID=2073160 RepID=UPI0013009F33|nr:ABC transporter ATP-binding protein [Acuticoccus kandeliae]
MSELLRVTDLNAYYGAYHALTDASFTIGESERVALFGHNGSGKSTLMKCFVGALPHTTGTVTFCGEAVEPGNVPRNVKLGVGYVPQSGNVFPTLSVERNLYIAGLMHGQGDLDDIWTLFPALEQRRRQAAGSMSGGEQQMLAFSMALLTKPKILLLDEPTSGLSPRMSQMLLDAVVDVSARKGIAFVLIEHNVPRTLAYVDRAIILKSGRMVTDIPASQMSEKDNLWEWF